ncbi:Multiple RNA-binding domain-containing protein 1 [Ascosphaera atra]|nr:Multiple RNA-binding domain-containing protein 1 [Ascosphaera atra]
MQSTKSAKTWADNATWATGANAQAVPQQDTSKKDDVAEEEQELSYAQKKKLKQGGDEKVAPSQEGVPEKEPAQEQPDEMDVDQPAEQAEAPPPVDDTEWLRSRTSRLLGLMDEEEEEEAAKPPGRIVTIDSDSEDEAPKGTNQTKAQQPTPESGDEKTEDQAEESEKTEAEVDANIDMIRKTGRLFVRNLSYTITEEELQPIFSPFGKVDEIHIAYDTRFERSKGFAYVQYFEPEPAIEAYKKLDGKDFQGRLLHILPASAKKTYKLDESELAKLPLKKQQQIKRKQEAQSQTFSWNSLYMNTDAVMASVAQRLGVQKADLLDPTASDAAVKQAHAETHVIQETKAYFAQNGVNLDSFKQKERGNTAILVKNFSFGVKIEDMQKLFEPYGQLKRLLMPPSGTIAIVEFFLPDEAQKAFKGLAYRKFGDSILFLEKAPKDLFDGKVAAAPIAPLTSTAPAAAAKEQHFSTSDVFNAEESNEVPVDTATLYVRNLNFSTTSAGLADVFRPLDGFLSAVVKTKPNPKKPGQTLSMGFGFVEFKSSAQAQSALRSMNGYRLDNHELIIKASHKGMDAAEARRKQDMAKKQSARSTKIIIKNLPFQATKKDIRSLFSAYGKLRSVRVPQKFDRTARGFAFADFVSAREAENAMDALKNTHLLGRRLVLDFASAEAMDAEEEIAKMEKKTSAQVDRVQMNQLVGGGRKKFQVGAGADEDQD